MPITTKREFLAASKKKNSLRQSKHSSSTSRIIFPFLNISQTFPHQHHVVTKNANTTIKCRTINKKRDKIKGIKGYLEVSPPCTQCSELSLTPEDSCLFLFFFTFYMYFIFFVFPYNSFLLCNCDIQISSFYIVHFPFILYHYFPSY